MNINPIIEAKLILDLTSQAVKLLLDAKGIDDRLFTALEASGGLEDFRASEDINEIQDMIQTELTKVGL